MAKRAKNAQYAYGITIEAGNYNEVINGFEKRLNDLDKRAQATITTFGKLNNAMKSGKQKTDFSNEINQLTGLVAEMEEVSRWREQLAGGQKLSDMFDGLDQVKQSLSQVTGQLDKFGDNIEEIFTILQNVPKNTAETFVDVRKVLQQQASDMSKIIKELNNPTDKTDVAALKKKLSGLVSDFTNEWNRATSQGIKMDQVVDNKVFATAIKGIISGAKALGTEFNEVSASVLATAQNVAALYNIKHPTGMFKDMASGMSGVESGAKKAEQASVKFTNSFKAAVSIADQFAKSDMGLGQKSKELEEFLNKLKNPKITIDLKNKDISDEFSNLEDKYENIVGFKNITPDFLNNLPTDKLKELGTTLQNIIAIGREFPDLLGFDDSPIDISDYESDLKKIIAEIKKELDEANKLIAESGNTLKVQLEKLGLKDIELQVKIADLTEEKASEYVAKLNKFVDDLTGQLANKGTIELPVDVKIPGITPDNAESKKVKDAIKNELKGFEDIVSDVSKSESAIKDARNKTANRIIANAFGTNENLDAYLTHIKTQFRDIRDTVKKEKEKVQELLTLDFTWNKGTTGINFSNLFSELQDYFADPENALKVEIDDKYLKERISGAFKEAGVNVGTLSTGTPIDQSQIAALIIAGLRGAISGEVANIPSIVKDTTSTTTSTPISSTSTAVINQSAKPKFVFDINEFMSKYNGDLSNELDKTLNNVVDAVLEVIRAANRKRVNEEARGKVGTALGSEIFENFPKILKLSDLSPNVAREEILSWIQNSLLKADESGRAMGADLPNALSGTGVKWQSVTRLSNALKQFFIKIESEARDVETAIKDRQKVDVLKDFGYRARAISSRSSVLRKLNKGELDSEFLTEELGKLGTVSAYKDNLPKGKSKGIVEWLDKAKGIYQNLLDIANGKTTFENEAEKQEEIQRLRKELSDLRVSDDKNLIEALTGEISVSKKQKNGRVTSGKVKQINGSPGNLEKVLSLIENADENSVITIKFVTTPNDKAFREFVETTNAYGKTINAPVGYATNNLKGEGKSSLTSPREERESLLAQEIDFKPFLKPRSPVVWDEYVSTLERKLAENDKALKKQEEIIGAARKRLTSAKRNETSASNKLYGEIDNSFIDKSREIKERAPLLFKGSNKKDNAVEEWRIQSIDYQKQVQESLNSALVDLENLAKEKDSTANRKKIQSVLQYIDGLKAGFVEFKRIESIIYEAYDFGEDVKPQNIKFEDLASSGNILDAYRQRKEILQENIDAIDREIADIEKQKGNIRNYTDEQKSLAKIQLDASEYYSDTESLRKQLDTKSILEEFKRKTVEEFRESDYFKGKAAEIRTKYSKDLFNEDGTYKKNIEEAVLRKINAEERAILEAYEKSININESKGTISYTSYIGENAQEVVANVINEKEQETIRDKLNNAKSPNTKKYLQIVNDLTAFISELENRLNSLPTDTPKAEKENIVRALNDARRILDTVRSVRGGGEIPSFATSTEGYEKIIADNSAEAERIAKAEKDALERRAKALNELSDFEQSSLGAEALRRAGSVKAGEGYSFKSADAHSAKKDAERALQESEERLSNLKQEQESLLVEKENLSQRKKYNELLVQERDLKELIINLTKDGKSTEEARANLADVQEKIAKKEKKYNDLLIQERTLKEDILRLDEQGLSSEEKAKKREELRTKLTTVREGIVREKRKLGINFEDGSSMTEKRASELAYEYDAQEKLLHSQIRALESKIDRQQDIIDNLTKFGLNSAKGDVLVRDFKDQKVSEFKDSDHYKTLQNQIRDKYLKGTYKVDGTLDSTDTLEGDARELVAKYSDSIDKLFFNVADIKEGEMQEFINSLVNDPTKFSNAFKGNVEVGKNFMDEFDQIKSFYWNNIRDEEREIISDYRESIKIDKSKGTASYTSYSGDTVQEVVVDLKQQIIENLRSQIENELKQILSEKEDLSIRVSEAKRQALEFSGLKESDLKNADIDNEISSRRAAIEGFNLVNMANINKRLEAAKEQGDEKAIAKELREKKAIEEKILVLEEEIKAWEFVKEARKAAAILNKSTNEEREATELSKIERYEREITESKERQNQIQEELNRLRGEEVKDEDAISRAQYDLETVTKKIADFEERKQKSEKRLGNIRERIATDAQAPTGGTSGGILSPIVSLLSEIRDILSKISGIAPKSSSGGSETPTSTSSSKHEDNSKISKYLRIKLGREYSREEWKKAQEDYAAGILTDLDEVLAREIQKKAESAKEDVSSVPDNQNNTSNVIADGVSTVKEEVVKQGVEKGKKEAKNTSNKTDSSTSKTKSTSTGATYAGGLSYTKVKEKIKSGASKVKDGLSLDEYVTQAQSLYNQVNSWVGEHNIEYFSKRLELGNVMQKAGVALGKDGFKNNKEKYEHLAKQYNMENVNNLVLTPTKLGNNKEIMEALADVKPVDTTPVTNAAQNIADKTVKSGANAAEVAVDKEVVAPITSPKKGSKKKKAEEQVQQSVDANTPEVKVTPTIEQGAIDKAVDENTAQTPATAEVKPEIAPASVSEAVKQADAVTQKPKENIEHVSDEAVKAIREFVSAISNMVGTGSETAATGGSGGKQSKPKTTLTNAQIAALNVDDTKVPLRESIKQFIKLRNWNDGSVDGIGEVLGLDNKVLEKYKASFSELVNIALDIKAKGESGTIITKDDLANLDKAIAGTKTLQSQLIKDVQYKKLKDDGLIVTGNTKIKSSDGYNERQNILSDYAKKYAAQNKSEYQFGQYDFINDRISFDMIDSSGKVTKTVIAWSEAFNSAYVQSSKLQSSLDAITQEVYKTDEAIKAGEEYGFFQGESEGLEEYKTALAEYEKQVKITSRSSQKNLAKNFELLHAAQEKVVNAGKDLLDKQKDAYGFNSAQNVIGREGNVGASLQVFRDQGYDVNSIKLVQKYNDALSALKQKMDALKQRGQLWDSSKQSELKVLANQANEAERELLEAADAQRRLNGEIIQGSGASFFEGVDTSNVNQLKQAMMDYAKSIEGVDKTSVKWNEAQKTVTYTVRTGKHEVSDFTVGMTNLTNEFYNARTGARTVKTEMEKFLDSIGAKFKEVGRYILSFGSFYRIWGEIRKGFQYVKEIDTALTELKKVTDETDETYKSFLKTMSQTGAEVGATVSNLTNMAASWARLGSIIKSAPLCSNT